jgi:Trk-type K+ transport system membrane component
MTTTFKAAYIADDGSSTSGGIRLTTEEQAGLSDAELLDEAMKEAKNIGLEISQSDISVGDWTE